MYSNQWFLTIYRSYSYYIEVSMDELDWIRVIDHSKYLCRSWQNLYFPARVCRLVHQCNVQWVTLKNVDTRLSCWVLLLHYVFLKMHYITTFISDAKKIVNLSGCFSNINMVDKMQVSSLKTGFSISSFFFLNHTHFFCSWCSVVKITQ